MMDLLIETSSGKIRGVVEKSSEGFDIYSFKGIPYAEPPIGELRFKDPVPIKKWTGIRDATKFGPISMQYDSTVRMKSENEDCLSLNVYVKAGTKPNARKAVMVWIHGGAFLFGSSYDTLYGPDYLVGHDIVLVSVNYRLGVLGFLNLEDEYATGNQGLKDQALALRWVHENIGNFGGDPGNVTIFGESAGGASVHYLCLSPLSKDYVHKAISQSGVIFNPWTEIKNPKKIACDLCKVLGKPLTNSKDIVEFLRTIDTKRLLEAQQEMIRHTDKLIFGPSSDPKSANPFMSQSIEKEANKGVHIPYLVGNTSREGIFFVQEEFSISEVKNDEAFKMMGQDINVAFPFDTAKVLNKYQVTPQQAKRLYYKSKNISVDNLESFVDSMSDLLFVEGIHEFVKVQVEESTSPTYLYQLSYDSESSFIKFGTAAQISGVSHFDDVRYLFKGKIYGEANVGLKKGTKDYRVMEQMTTLWTNFAKYGKPTIATSKLIPVNWKPVTDKTVLRYLNIDEDLTMQSVLNLSLKLSSAQSIVA
ncbi:carboxylesterase clade A, member 3 [Nasonia vitripennis]|uniref:Carboxylic ester hydrolase n=1 Tax=Nasonia vitripennis TaxID=7425 RepID=A0A7M6UMA5_NASVI|nr:carboxylesterase clade A, member 3 [Nasonia vitripennis]